MGILLKGAGVAAVGSFGYGMMARSQYLQDTMVTREQLARTYPGSENNRNLLQQQAALDQKYRNDLMNTAGVFGVTAGALGTVGVLGAIFGSRGRTRGASSYFKRTSKWVRTQADKARSWYMDGSGKAPAPQQLLLPQYTLTGRQIRQEARMVNARRNAGETINVPKVIRMGNPNHLDDVRRNMRNKPRINSRVAARAKGINTQGNLMI